MRPFTANPFVYLFSIAAIAAALFYYGFALFDRAALAPHEAAATVTGKQFNAGGTSYYTNVVAGRAWTQSQPTPETYVVMLRIGGEQTVGLVTKEMFETLRVNDPVTVTFRRTRFTGRLEVTRVAR